MGQKVNPLILRIGFIKTWSSRWYAKPKEFPANLKQDVLIRKHIKGRFKQAAVARIVIERMGERVRVQIFSARPGIIIGRHGADIEKLREDLNALVKKEVSVDIKEIGNPALEAQLVAENVAQQLEKRIAFRRAVKRAIEQSMNSGAKGVKIIVAGRLNGAEIARTETFRQGKIPLTTLRADIDYGFTEALTTYGLIGVKVWLYRGEVLDGVMPVTPEPEKRQSNERRFSPKAPAAKES